MLSLAALLTGTSMASSFTDSREFKDWWNGKGLLRGSGENSARLGSGEPNPIFKGRSDLEDQGVKFSGRYKGAFFSLVGAPHNAKTFDGKSYWGQQMDFGVELNPARILNLDELNGLKLFFNARYRDSETRRVNPNDEYGINGDSSFNPNHMWSGRQFRITSFGLEYGTKDLLPVKDMITVRAGYLQPNREFLNQPLSKLFMNNMIESAKGVGANIKFSSSYSNWGTTIEVKPHKDFYLKNGIFMSSWEQDETRNHGLAFEGFNRDTKRNGLWEMAEIGWTPKFTEAKLEGRYAVGGYYLENRVGTTGGGVALKTGGPINYRYGMYIQADQMLWREPSEDPSKLKKEGLNLFSMVSLTPDNTLRQSSSSSNLAARDGANKFPVYFQTGLVYTGLLPSREKDTTEIALGYADWTNGGPTGPYTSTHVVEGGYTLRVNGWLWARPFFQYIRNPAGNGTRGDATVLGMSTGFTF
jgi:carbohydrate-selective porin OprB